MDTIQINKLLSIWNPGLFIVLVPVWFWLSPLHARVQRGNTKLSGWCTVHSILVTYLRHPDRPPTDHFPSCTVYHRDRGVFVRRVFSIIIESLENCRIKWLLPKNWFPNFSLITRWLHVTSARPPKMCKSTRKHHVTSLCKSQANIYWIIKDSFRINFMKAC